MTRIARLAGVALVLALAAGLHAETPDARPAESPDSAAPADAGKADGGDRGGKPIDLPAAGLPHIHVDREKGVVDIDARVVMREGKWLELIACTPNSREHESLVTVLARPSHIHLALLTLGLKPGKPLEVEKVADGYKVHPPHGPPVAVSFVVTENGETREMPANEWVINQETGEIMADNLFLFTGSVFVNYEGKEIYAADMGGTVASLVNFGDDLLSRDTTDTNNSDNQAWNANTPRIPPLDTEVLLRLRPVKTEP